MPKGHSERYSHSTTNLESGRFCLSFQFNYISFYGLVSFGLPEWSCVLESGSDTQIFKKQQEAPTCPHNYRCIEQDDRQWYCLKIPSCHPAQWWLFGRHHLQELVEHKVRGFNKCCWLISEVVVKETAFTIIIIRKWGSIVWAASLLYRCERKVDYWGAENTDVFSK